MMLLLSMDSFQKEVAEFRDHVGIKLGGNKGAEQEKWLSSIAPQINAYLEVVSAFIRIYHLPENYHRHVRTYIEMGIISWPVNNFAVIPAGYGNQVVQPLVYAKLNKSEAQDLVAEISRFSNDLPSFGTIKNLDQMLASEELYKVRDELNQSNDREYLLTVKEQDKWGAKQHYEHKRTLDEQRKKRFGKK